MQAYQRLGVEAKTPDGLRHAIIALRSSVHAEYVRHNTEQLRQFAKNDKTARKASRKAMAKSLAAAKAAAANHEDAPSQVGVRIVEDERE